ncbi:phage protein D [Pseudorhizobium tarimense]|uniref:Phage protein D n=1 Tax=Pseudorhizobium tarimense TaxID=1079109 RepID=A0ABV2H1X7_9HYPH|nr:late control D family protein [Pseudorhizobium tarimense]MCJ8517839.1 late control D family protein [Pseudorhizobium tarimense]
MPWTVDWKVFVDGEDVTSAMQPFLMKISISDKDGSASDTCSLELDDSGGQLKLPAEGASVEVFLQGISAFSGKVDSVRSKGARGSGRSLSVGAKSFDVKGKAKEPQSHHMDDASLQQFLDKAAKGAGLKGITIDPAFAGIVRDYWSASSESFLHLGQKLARELGGTFKIRGDQAVLAKRGQGLSAMGQPLPTIVGIAPPPNSTDGNVINWDIAPLEGRAKFARTKARYFDRASASFKEIEVETGVEAEAASEVRTTVADKDQAKAVAEGRKTNSEREGGQGSVEMDLDATAQAEGTFIMKGARPGIDGVYRISGVDKKADRSGGATMRLEIKQPTEGAGKDDRQPSTDKTGTFAGGEGGTSGGAAGGVNTSPAQGRSDSFAEYNRRYGRTDEN